MSFRAVEMQYRKHAKRLSDRCQREGRGPTKNEVRGVAFYLYSAEQVWNLQREKPVPSGGFEMREELRPFGGFK